MAGKGHFIAGAGHVRGVAHEWLTKVSHTGMAGCTAMGLCTRQMRLYDTVMTGHYNVASWAQAMTPKDWVHHVQAPSCKSKSDAN